MKKNLIIFIIVIHHCPIFLNKKKMNNTVWVGLGVVIGLGIGLILRTSIPRGEKEPFYYKRYAQKGDFALRDTESAISRADF